MLRDRRRDVSRGVDANTRMIALLTVLFEAGGLLLAASRTGRGAPTALAVCYSRAFPT